MPDDEPFELNLGWIPSQVSRLKAGAEVRILFRGVPVLGFNTNDKEHRDIVIATLLKADLSGKQTAELCSVSESEVTRVRQRYEEGGMAALMKRPVQGSLPRPVTPKERKKILAMRHKGASIDAIIKAMKSSYKRVNGVLKEAGLGGTGRGTRFAPKQLDLLDDAQPGETLSEPPKERRATRIGIVPAASSEDDALRPGEPIASSGIEHTSRYAGIVMLGAQLGALGIRESLASAKAERSPKAVYSAATIATALCAAYGAGYASIESMHERDAHALGLVLGIERCPSVRTLHRALPQMLRTFDSIALGAELIRQLAHTRAGSTNLFGVDGHFKAYSGKAPIDKGWNSKKRLAQKGLLDIVVMDRSGRTWVREQVAAGDGLSEHLPHLARRLREVLGIDAPLTFACDRGGFSFDVLAELDAMNVHYIMWVPWSVKLPDLGAIAPAMDGFGEVPFEHERMLHRSRLLVERDGDALLPACTNLPLSMGAATVVALLRSARGMQENTFKSARKRVHIDRLSDRGVSRIEPDARLCENPVRVALTKELEQVNALVAQIESCPERCVQNGDWTSEYAIADIRQKTLSKQIRETPARVERQVLQPGAKRAFLTTRRRDILVPLKYATENAMRELEHRLGGALSTTDNAHDATTRARTLLALLQSPGTIRFADDEVVVTIEFPLPPKPHQRLADALIALDDAEMKFTDGQRRVRFRLAPRPRRQTDKPRDSGARSNSKPLERRGGLV